MGVRAMRYEKRLTIAIICSAIVHLAVFSGGAYRLRDQHFSLSMGSDPVVFSFEPGEPAPPEPPPPPTRSLVDTLAPTNEPVEPTDLIAEQNSKAQDMADVEGTRPAPFVEKASEFDQLAAPAPVPVAPDPPKPAVPPQPPSPPLSPEQPKPAAVPPPPEPPKPATAPPPSAPEQSDMAEKAPAKPDGPAQDATKPNDAMQPFQVAQAGGAPQPGGLPTLPSPLPVGDVRGRVDGGVKGEGFTSFEAMADEIAPYLKEIRNRVERNWRSALQFRYTGTSPTKAVLDCAINPEGQVVSATIIESGSSPTYAALCKEAVEKAGPFGPFPFQVPDMYRSKNLEIRWTFSFLLE